MKLYDLSYMDLVNENKKRHSVVNMDGYNPITGEGSLIPRIKIYKFRDEYCLFPAQMKTIDLVMQIILSGSVEQYVINVKNIKKNTPKYFDEVEMVWYELLNHRLDEDFEFWAITGATIQDKRTKKPKKFRLNYPQMLLLKDLEEQRVAGLPIREILVKARQWGGSTLIQIYMVWIQTRRKSSWHSAIIGQVENQSKNIRAMLTRVAKHYPSDIGTITLRPYEQGKSRIIAETESIINIGSAEKPDNLRSFDLCMAHLSEVGFWKPTEGKTPEDLVQSIRASILNEPDTLIAIESTAKGVGSFFHQEWLDAVNGVSGYHPLFIPFFYINNYQRSIDDIWEFRQKLVSSDDKTKGTANRLWELGASLESINWYFHYKASERYDENRMNNEFPPTAEDAFTSTSENIFSIEDIHRQREYTSSPTYIGNLTADGRLDSDALKNIKFVRNPGGSLWIWEMPDLEEKVSNRYVVFLDIGGRSFKSDWSVLRVLDRYWRMYGGKSQFVATWKLHIDHDILAWKAAQLAAFYDNALLAVEINSLLRDAEDKDTDHAVTILDTIMDCYPNLYMRTTIDSITKQESTKPGFLTTSKTKNLIIDTMNAALRDDQYQECDARALDEASIFVQHPDGTMGNVKGKGLHDDMVITSAGCLYLDRHYMPMPKIISSTPIRNKIRTTSVAII